MITLKDFTYSDETKLNSFEQGDLKVKYMKIQDGILIEFDRFNIGVKQYILKSLDDSDLQKAIDTCITDIAQNMRKYEKTFKAEKQRILMDGLLIKNFR